MICKRVENYISTACAMCKWHSKVQPCIYIDDEPRNILYLSESSIFKRKLFRSYSASWIIYWLNMFHGITKLTVQCFSAGTVCVCIFVPSFLFLFFGSLLISCSPSLVHQRFAMLQGQKIWTRIDGVRLLKIHPISTMSAQKSTFGVSSSALFKYSTAEENP